VQDVISKTVDSDRNETGTTMVSIEFS
jgi:hypothetical protein